LKRQPKRKELEEETSRKRKGLGKKGRRKGSGAPANINEKRWPLDSLKRVYRRRKLLREGRGRNKEE